METHKVSNEMDGWMWGRNMKYEDIWEYEEANDRFCEFVEDKIFILIKSFELSFHL